MPDLVVRRIGRLLTMAGPVVTGAAVLVRGGRVAWTGLERDLPAVEGDVPELDAGGAVVLPGFVDCHTHLVWAGDRRGDFEARLSGRAYDAGGIAATVAATRDAPSGQLLAGAQQRVETALRAGTTTVEVKSGYGLTTGQELRLLDVINGLAGPVVEATYLGAHVVPAERDRAEYVEEVVAALPAARARGARWCDVFCDEGAFTVAEARRILTAARECGLGLRLHAEQLARTGAAELAADLGAASADHLDRIDPAGAAALAAAGTVAVLVPVASLYTRSASWRHAGVLRAAGCTLAIATDCNPGTSWCESMPYAVQLACLGFGLTVAEALWAATRGGAAALRRSDVGHLGEGARADMVVAEADHEVDVVAHLGVPAVRRVVLGGAPR